MNKVNTKGDATGRSPTTVSKESRQQRLEALKRLFEMFKGNDADEEVRQLKREDQGF